MSNIIYTCMYIQCILWWYIPHAAWDDGVSDAVYRGANALQTSLLEKTVNSAYQNLSE